MFPFPERSLVLYIYRVATQGFLSSLEFRVQFCLLVCCTYPSLSTVNKEKNLTDQRASLRVDTRETQHIERETGLVKDNAGFGNTYLQVPLFLSLKREMMWGIIFLFTLNTISALSK